VPGGDDTAGDGFTNRGNFYFDGHARELCRACGINRASR
jgi:hypothetical protein